MGITMEHNDGGAATDTDSGNDTWGEDGADGGELIEWEEDGPGSLDVLAVDVAATPLPPSAAAAAGTPDGDIVVAGPAPPTAAAAAAGPGARGKGPPGLLAFTPAQRAAAATAHKASLVAAVAAAAAADAAADAPALRAAALSRVPRDALPPPAPVPPRPAGVAAGAAGASAGVPPPLPPPPVAAPTTPYDLGPLRRGRLRDVSRRYAPDWPAALAARSPDGFYAALLAAAAAPDTAAADATDDADAAEWAAAAAAAPLPRSEAAARRHPVYVLGGHLKKYEALRPGAAPVGALPSGVPVYARADVAALHTRDVWARHLHAVCDGEVAYKTVASRSAAAGAGGAGAPPAELYGDWQTAPLVVPAVGDGGAVPRGPRGAVELWSPAHLPAGAVHVPSAYAAGVAAALGFDAPPAMVGFDIRSGRRPSSTAPPECRPRSEEMMGWLG
ncbi:hypothetical protein I4F81_005963 [Pyropia yezoensis]|uniref:Uncharacterized protein n=1 Tax=Pyropia yezoensis TaxID=2788 RepID=A0ACC3BZR5_PYRYE|nr:hypothetical protein I4F81_005963 [Neopyropia yezoensis]